MKNCNHKNKEAIRSIKQQIIMSFPACQEDILMVAELYYHIELTTQTIIILSSMSWDHMTK